MADIELVIKMPEEVYRYAKKYNVSPVLALREMSICMNAITNGTPLPKGHGRIADMDAAIKCIEDVEGEDAIWAISLIKWACSKRTIIEAYKEQTDGNND
jgi:hypothetical protein